MISFFRGFKKGNELFGDTIAALVNTFLLTIVYVLGVGLTSIFAKIVQKKFLNIREEKIQSYWKDINLTTKEINEYYRQF